MKTWLAAALAACGLWVADSASAEDWVKVSSPHFTVYSNVSPSLARQFTEKLEAFDYTLYEMYKAKNAGEKPDVPAFKVFLLRRQSDLANAWPDVGSLVGGFYRSCSEGAIAYSPLSSTVTGSVGTRISRDRKDGYNFDILFHEYAHHFMFQNYNTPVPKWYVEGFAEYLTTVDIEGRSISIGLTDSDRYTELMSGPWLRYDDLLNDKIRYNGNDSLKFYAQSWLLTHWIMTSPERLAKFGAYVDRVNGGADPVTTFTEQFGVAPSDLEKTLRAYLAKGVPVVSFTFKDIPDPAITVTDMPASADKLLMWHSRLESCVRDSDDKADLLINIRTEAAKYPGDTWAQLVLARAEIQIGDPGKAEAILSAAVTAEPTNAEAQFLLGRFHYARGDTAKARTAFSAVYKLNPTWPVNLYYMSLSQPQTSPPTATALNAAIQASNLAPSEEVYAFHAAFLLTQTGDLESVEILLTPSAADPHNEEIATKARAIIAAIKAGQSKDAILALFGE